MSSKPEKGNAATRRCFRIIELLAGRFFDGLTNKELLEHIKTSPANLCRDLQLLEDMGYARKQDNGHWGCTTKPMAIFQSYVIHAQNLQNRMAETSRNIMAGATGLSS